MNSRKFAKWRFNESFPPIRQHGLQIRVIYFWFRAAGEVHFFRLAGGGDADSLSRLRWFLFAIVIIGDLIFVAVAGEADFSQINLGAKVMRVLELRLRPG